MVALQHMIDNLTSFPPKIQKSVGPPDQELLHMGATFLEIKLGILGLSVLPPILLYMP